MLEKIQFINYKCFEDATIPLREITIAVGKNNAGKSTMIEGLRLIALAIKVVKNIIIKIYLLFFSRETRSRRNLI